MAIVIALRRIDRGWKVVLVGGLAGGMLEFAMSLIQQLSLIHISEPTRRS